MDHYKTLGVEKNSNPDEIKKAYRKLASKHHPDKGGDTAMFQQIQIAYDTLSDPDKRQQYDNPAPHGFNGGPGFGFNFNGVDINDIFGQMFRQHAQQAQQPRSHVYRTTVWITLDQVYSGDEHVIRLQTPTGTPMVKIDIPKGIHDGAQMRYDKIVEGASLIVEFRTHPHLKFERKLNDLYSNQSISVLDLIVGGTFEFTTLSGKTLEVSVPPKTQPFMSMKLAGYGLPIMSTNHYGDQIILLKPFIPDTIDERITNSILLSRNQ